MTWCYGLQGPHLDCSGVDCVVLSKERCKVVIYFGVHPAFLLISEVLVHSLNHGNHMHYDWLLCLADFALTLALGYKLQHLRIKSI